MERYAVSDREALDARILCLGNDLLADDALGFRVADELRSELGDPPPTHLEVVVSPESGFALLDHLMGARRVIVVDTALTGRAEPGTVYRIENGEDWYDASGVSPHYVGLFEALAVGRALRLPVAESIVILAVEAADVVTVGGPICAAVEAAVLRVLAELGVLLGREAMGERAVAGREVRDGARRKRNGRPARARSD